MANGLATTVATPARLATSSSRPGSSAQPPGQHHMVDLVVRGRSEEELQRAGDLERQRLHERLQHVAVVVLRQPLVLLGRFRLFGRQVERALDILGQLVAAERLVPGEQELVVAQHVEVRHVGADVDQRDVLVAPVGRQRRRDQPECLLRRVRFDVHHQRPQARGFGDGYAVLDLLLARRGDQHLDLVGVVRGRPQDLEVEVDLVQRERDVLVGLGLDLSSSSSSLWPAGTMIFLVITMAAGSAMAMLRCGCPGASSRAAARRCTWSRLAMLPSVTASLVSGSIA